MRHWWRELCVKLPFGLRLIGPQARNVISAALDDAADFRGYGARATPDGCTACLNEDDLGVLVLAGISAPELKLCPDHQLDADCCLEYRALLDRIGTTDRELAKLRARQFMRDLENGDAV